MDLRQLEILKAIAETGSFTAAGSKLRVSQSAISRQILLLEQELGDQVFHRVGRRVRITPAGEALVQLSLRIFQDVQDTLADLSERQESPRGVLRLVGGMTVCLYVFPALLAELRRHHPRLDLKVTTGSSERCIAELRSGVADLGMLTLPIDAPDLVAVPVLQEELLLITEPSHPLARKRRVMASDLTRQPFVLFESGSNTRRVLDEFFLREHIDPRIVMETENVEIIKAMVRAGMGIGIVPYQAVADDVASRQLFCSRITGHPLFRESGWIYPKMSRLPRTVAEVLRVLEVIRPKLRLVPPGARRQA
ncbi:MAG: LysR family transcriptional regulator [Vicinamibacterales bacterium]